MRDKFPFFILEKQRQLNGYINIVHKKKKVNIEMIWSYVYTCICTDKKWNNKCTYNSGELNKENKLIGYRIWKWGCSMSHFQIL